MTLQTNRTVYRMALVLTALALLFFVSLLFGAGPVGWQDSLWLLTGHGEGLGEQVHFTLFELRLPRTLLAIIVGAGLGASGVVLQTVTRNTLAEPGLLGVSAGASFAIVMAIYWGASASALNLQAAMAGALAGCLLVLAASQVSGTRQDPVRLILAGAALSGLLLAISSVLLLLDQRTADEMRFWLIGALAGRPFEAVRFSGLVTLAGICVLLFRLPALSALSLGHAVAVGLGHRPWQVQLTALLVVALLVGEATAAAGPIAFIGLVAPFAARAWVGPDIRNSFWPSLLLGSCILLAADIISRLVVIPYELPVGVVTAFIGAPVLLAVVRRQRMPTL